LVRYRTLTSSCTSTVQTSAILHSNDL